MSASHQSPHTISLGTRLKIRSMIHMAAEPIPFFWPMRTFIHHNPLHGLEHLPFPQAVQEGEALFHGRGYLLRQVYQQYLTDGKVDESHLQQEIQAYLAQSSTMTALANEHLQDWLLGLMTQTHKPVSLLNNSLDPLTTVADVYAVLHQQTLPEYTHAAAQANNIGKHQADNDDDNENKRDDPLLDNIIAYLKHNLLGNRPVYEAVDALYGTDLSVELNETLVKSCLSFFDEGQAAWAMPNRHQGFFYAWRELARCHLPLVLRSVEINRILDQADTAEGIIAYVLAEFHIPEPRWMDYFTRELSHLHGWVGFIRWRSSAKHYHWQQTHAGDLIDFMAIRLTLALASLRSRQLRNTPHTRQAIRDVIEQQPMETFLRYELHGKRIMPAMAVKVEQALTELLTRNKQKKRRSQATITTLFNDYVQRKRQHQAQKQASRLQDVAALTGQTATLQRLSAEQLATSLNLIGDFEQHAEGMIWLRSMEAKAMQQLIADITQAWSTTRSTDTSDQSIKAKTDKRPFAQALFCIDTRSERIRRHLESVGDYQTYGIAGFFGVPVSFMELGKGSELHLCPVILSPHNVVLELSASDLQDDHLITVLEHAVHDLKASILPPFVTVEAIGLLFGFDMIGKTVAPRLYHHWRKHLHAERPATHLLLDKLSRSQASSILRTVQRAIIVRAMEQELRLATEYITDDMIFELREAAMHEDGSPARLDECIQKVKVGNAQLQAFVERLRRVYRINPSAAQLQMERLGKIGFTLDEQTNYVSQALSAIGLRHHFSRFVLLVGHGSRSENNPYESALDCGACGGNHGLISAKVLSQMANKPEVRRRLNAQGISIPDDTWFLPALHNTTTDEVELLSLELMPSSLLVYIDRLRNGLNAASRLSAQERIPTLAADRVTNYQAATAFRNAQRNAVDWSQVRPEWGLSRNAYFIIGRRTLTKHSLLDGRAFLHSYDYRIDPKRRLLENIITGPLVVGQWINMEHYFSAVDNDRFGSGSKVNQNVAGRFGVMTGNVSDLRTGLPAQTVLKNGLPYHEPIRLITVIEAPLIHAQKAIKNVATVNNLVNNAWIRLLVIDPETQAVSLFDQGKWQDYVL